MDDEKKVGRKRPLILAALAGVVAILLGGLVVLSPSAASDLATVRPLEPTVRLQQPSADALTPITTAVATNEGAKIETDDTGMAEISYFDGSLTRLGAETEYELSTLEDLEDRAIVGDLEIGRTFHRVTELTGSGDRWEVRTSNAVAAVRGTRFIVVCLQRDVCVFGVIEGVVEVLSRHTGERCIVRAGEELTVFADGTCSDIRPLDLNDPWLRLNLRLEGIDLEELQRRLFGEDREPGTDDDPEPEDLPGFDGTGGGFASGGRGGGGGRTGGGGGSGGGGSGGGGSGPGDEVLGEQFENPNNPPGTGSTTTAAPGQTSTTRPGQGSTTTRPGQGTSTTRPGQGTTTTTRPGQGTTTTTRPGQGTTTTTRPTSTTQPPTTSTTRTCWQGYPPTQVPCD